VARTEPEASAPLEARSDRGRGERGSADRADERSPRGERPTKGDRAPRASADRPAKARTREKRPAAIAAPTWWPRLRQLTYLGGMLGSAYTSVALASYSSTDSGFIKTNSGKVANAAGPFGAGLADVLLEVFGYGAALVPLLGVAFGLKLAGRTLGGMVRVSAGVILAWALLCVGALVAPAVPDAIAPGGVVGQASVDALTSVVGPAGSWITLAGVMIFTGTFVAQVDWERVAAGIVGFFEGLVPRIGAAGAAVGRSAVGGMRSGASAVAGKVKSLSTPRKPTRVARGEEEEEGDEEYDFAFEDRSDPSGDEEWEEEDEDDEELDEDSEEEESDPRPARRPAREEPEPADRPSDRTRPVDRSLAEVEWEHTEAPKGALTRPAPLINEPIEPTPSALPPGHPVAPPPAAARPPRKAAPELPPKTIALNPNLLVSGGADDGGAVVQRPDRAAFELPHLGLLDEHPRDVAEVNEIELRATGDILEQKLNDFGISGEISAIRPGPVITTFEYLPAAGIKLSRITALEDDIAMALKALSVRIVAPIPGKGVVGFEVPNKKRQTVWARDILASETFRKMKFILPMALGKNVEGKPEIADLAKAPHLLVAGTTGSGKSVGVNAMLLSMLYTRTPEELRLILIDPKMLEFELYQDIPHLLHPVVTDAKLASAALKWACDEMDERYRAMARWKARNIEGFNERVTLELENWTPAKARQYAPSDWPEHEPIPRPKKLPYIVIVIDELADLMMVAAKDVEVSIARLAQKARAAGIHLIVATQRPEKTVVTGIIKANLPSRIAFQVRSKLDGRIVLDQGGAETLLGKGDMLFLPPSSSDLARIHGPFVGDEEVRRVTDFLRAQGAPEYEADIRVDEEGAGDQALSEEDYDPLYDLAVAYVTQLGKASTSMVQREFKIGYNRAARILEVMEKEGVVGPADGARPREVLVPGAR